MINKSPNEQEFVFIINDDEYKCNINGVNSSMVIRKLREKDPNLYHYNYAFNNSNHDFETICNYFKNYELAITANNMRSLLQIAEDLQIENILDDIHHFINTYENIVDESEYTTEIFHQLYNIIEFTVENVKKYIIKSKFVESYEKIQELAAFILQVVRTSYKCQPYIIDLLILIDESSNENNNLKKLLPFIVDKTLESFFKTPFLCSFIFKMSKRGIITVDKIINHIYFLDPEFETLEKIYHDNISLWFFPELIETKKYKIKTLLNNIDDKKANYIRLYYPDKIDLYKKIRDFGEPDNELMQSVLHDDIETFISIISKNNIDINSKITHFYLYDINNENIQKSYINYAAENGSLKCFKYLLLNHASIDNLTLQCSVAGRNTEIIRIVDNLQTNQSFDSDPAISNSMIKAIEMHNNEIFDWLFENKVNINIPYNENISKYINTAAINGNIYSLIKFADKIRVSRYYYNLYNIISNTSKLGFYQMTKFLGLLYLNYGNSVDMILSSIEFGNLSIFKIYENKLDTSYFEHYKEELLLTAIHKNYLNIVKYIIEEVYMPFNEKSFIKFYSNSLKLETPDIFNYLQCKFSYQYLKNYFNYDSKTFLKILYDGVPFGNMESIQKTTDFIIRNYPDTDFTDLLIHICKSCLEDMCLYFLEKSVKFNFITIMQNYNNFLFKNGKVALKLIEIAPPIIKFALSQYFLNESIQIKNYEIVKLLINDKCFNNQALYAAVQSHDIEFVDKILKIDNRPSFVNQISENGTALNIAVENNDVHIVKLLLNVPGINTNLYKLNVGDTPLILSLKNKNIEIAKHLLENQNTNINIRNMKQETALTIATENQFQDIISILVNNPNFDADESNVNYAFFLSTNSISKQLYQIKKLNVNFFMFQKSVEELNMLETVLMHAVRQNQLEKIDLIINDVHFDPIVSLINEAIVISLYTDKETIFKKLYNFIKNNNENLLSYINQYLFNSILNGKIEYVEKILLFEEVEIEKKYLLELFVNSPLKTMKKILNYDEMHHHYINFDQLLPNGKSFFTQISDEGNEISIITQFFLDNNVNPNKADKYNIYPLEHAINENSIDMVKTLINSGKIDFTMKKKETEETYLHLAVHCSNHEIVNEIYKQNKIIADSISKYDETPILKAINISNFDNAAILSREDGNESVDIEKSDKQIYINHNEIIHFLKSETEKGDPYYTAKLGIYYELGFINLANNNEEACKLYKKSADKENFFGLHLYGYALAHGVGINVNYKEACKYFKKGIKKGCIYSMIHYGYMLDNGFGVSINHDEANFYYDYIAKIGRTDEICKFAEFFEDDIFFPKNLKEACRYYKIAADRGDRNAMLKFANMLENGIGIPKDVEIAKTYYKMAEEKKESLQNEDEKNTLLSPLLF